MWTVSVRPYNYDLFQPQVGILGRKKVVIHKYGKFQ